MNRTDAPPDLAREVGGTWRRVAPDAATADLIATATVSRSPFSGLTVTHDAAYSPSGRDFFTITHDGLRPDAPFDEDQIRRIAVDVARRNAAAPAILASLAAIRKRYERAFTPRGMSLGDVTVVGVDFADDGAVRSVEASLSYDALDDRLERTRHYAVAREPHHVDKGERDSLVEAPRRQRRLASTLAGRKAVDARRICARTAMAIEGMGAEERRETLARVLDAVRGRCEEAEDRRHGLQEFRFADGVLSARVHVGGMSVRRGALTIRGVELPHQVAQALPGRQVADVVEHPLLAEAEIVAARRTANGATMTITEPATRSLRVFLETVGDVA